jgi:hypothetical protein
MWTCDDRISGTVNSKFSAYLPSQGLVIDGSIPTRLYEPSRGKQYPHWADLIVRSAFLSGGSSNSTSCPKRMDESFVERYTLDNVSHKGKTRGSLDSRALPEEIKMRTMDNVDQAGVKAPR